MLKEDLSYRRNDGSLLTIGGRVKCYSEETPWVWSINGDWYNENTGAFVSMSKLPWSSDNDCPKYKRVELNVDAWRSIANHDPISEETTT